MANNRKPLKRLEENYIRTVGPLLKQGANENPPILHRGLIKNPCLTAGAKRNGAISSTPYLIAKTMLKLTYASHKLRVKHATHRILILCYIIVMF